MSSLTELLAHFAHANGRLCELPCQAPAISIVQVLLSTHQTEVRLARFCVLDGVEAPAGVRQRLHLLARLAIICPVMPVRSDGASASLARA